MMESGYDVPFTTEVDTRFLCPICLLVLREPVQTACGHRFCDACIRRVILASNQVLTCPVDKQYSRVNQMFPDLAIRREILSLYIKCPNAEVEEGCTWRGELRDLEKHSEVCRMEEMKCPHGCDVTTKRFQLEAHMAVCPSRQVKCQHCKEQVIHRELEKHISECPKALVKCELCNLVSVSREDMKKHTNPDTGTCEKVPVKCPYNSFGCTFQAERSRMKFHANCPDVMSQHLELARNKVSAQDQNIKELKDMIQTLTKKTEDLAPLIEQNKQRNMQLSRSMSDRNVTGRVHWKIKVNRQRPMRGNPYLSPMLYTGCPGYKVQLGLDIDGHRESGFRYCTLFLNLLPGEYDEQIIFPFNATCLVTVYDQAHSLSQRNNFTCTMVVREVPRVQMPGHAGDRIYRRSHNTLMKKQDLIGPASRYLRNGALHMEVTILHCFYPPPEMPPMTCPALTHSALPHGAPVQAPGSPVVSVASLTIGNQG